MQCLQCKGGRCGCGGQARCSCGNDEGLNRVFYTYLNTLNLFGDKEATDKLFNLLKDNRAIRYSEVMKAFGVEGAEFLEPEVVKSTRCVFTTEMAGDQCINCSYPYRHKQKYPSECSALI